MKTIACVIPSYNQQEFLLESIESVLAQKRKPDEFVIIDDGSNDDSLDYAKSYETQGVKVISQVNKGLSSARNTGIMNTLTDYILFLDADDLLLENALERIMEVAEKTNADVIAPSFRCFGTRQGDVILQPQIIIQDFIGGNRIGYFSAIKRSVLLEVGGYSPRMVEGYEDYHLWFDIFKRGHSLITLPDILVLYRTKEKSMYLDAVENHHEKLMNQIKKDHKEIFG
ncbi:MAG: glycosyltransferase family 2 protein [Nanoarchaeota archaeon]